MIGKQAISNADITVGCNSYIFTDDTRLESCWTDLGNSIKIKAVLNSVKYDDALDTVYKVRPISRLGFLGPTQIFSLCQDPTKCKFVCTMDESQQTATIKLGLAEIFWKVKVGARDADGMCRVAIRITVKKLGDEIPEILEE